VWVRFEPGFGFCSTLPKSGLGSKFGQHKIDFTSNSEPWLGTTSGFLPLPPGIRLGVAGKRGAEAPERHGSSRTGASVPGKTFWGPVSLELLGKFRAKNLNITRSIIFLGDLFERFGKVCWDTARLGTRLNIVHKRCWGARRSLEPPKPCFTFSENLPRPNPFSRNVQTRAQHVV
jgi:hypothetical protein